MGCMLASAMKRLLLLLLPLCFAQADCETPTGLTQSCASKVQSATYNVDGACGAAGIAQISVPVAGECNIGVLANQAIGLPTNGTYEGTAEDTGYDLTRGNWKLESTPTGTPGDNSGITCFATVSGTAGDLTLSCTLEACTPSGDGDDTFQCSSVSCPKHLTPAAAGAMPDLDAGLSGDTGATGGDAGLTQDAGAAG